MHYPCSLSVTPIPARGPITTTRGIDKKMTGANKNQILATNSKNIYTTVSRLGQTDFSLK